MSYVWDIHGGISSVVLGDRCDIPGRMVEMKLIWIIAVVALVGGADAKTVSDLTELIAENSLVVDSMDLEELVFFVGTKGFDVSREGMVSLEDGQVDLRKYI